MSVEVSKFINKGGKEIEILLYTGGRYPIKMGYMKAQAVLDNIDQTKQLLEARKAVITSNGDQPV